MRRPQRRGSARAASKRLRFAAISSGLSSGMARSAFASPAIGAAAGRRPAPDEIEAPLAFRSALLRLAKCFAVSLSSPASGL